MSKIQTCQLTLSVRGDAMNNENGIAARAKGLLSCPLMSITAKIKNGSVTLPPELKIPDGTEVEIMIPAIPPPSSTPAGPVHLPVFNGGGLQPGVNLDDSRATRQLLDESGKLSQLA